MGNVVAILAVMAGLLIIIIIIICKTIIADVLKEIKLRHKN
jgi:hypothetical protein